MRYVALGVILLGYASFVWWFVSGITGAGNDIITSQQALSQSPPVPVAIVRFDEVQSGLVVPTWHVLNINREWVYVSAQKNMPLEWQPPLTEIEVAHNALLVGGQIQPKANAALTELFAAAEQAGYSLAVISAYRSATEQQELYDSTVLSRGPEYAAQYIALPGQSEHQLGLAVDLADNTPECLAAISACSLTSGPAAWLEEHAPQFGFILRYPEGKSAQTGISHEPWHFRYVGEYMAKFVQKSGLTYDEIITRLEQEASS